MRGKIVYLSYPLLTNIVTSITDRIDSPYPIEIIEVEVGESRNLAEKLDNDESVLAVVTVRGHAIFMPKMKNTPLIINKVSGDDLLNAYEKAAKITDKVVVMRVGEIFDEFMRYDSLFNLHIYHDTYQNVDEAREKMTTWINKGINTFIGTTVVNNEAKKLGVYSLYIYSEKSIMESIEQAIHIVRSKESEKIKYERINTIIQNSANALLATDAKGKIEYLNSTFLRLFESNERDLIGKYVIDLLPNFQFDKLLKIQKPIENYLINIRSIHIIANITPIIIKKNIEGFVITFQEVSKVSDADTKIRKELAKKGLLAKYQFADIIYKSEIMFQTIERAKVYSVTDSTILIYGETGTGKELFAQSIHNYSNRKQHSFVAINCSALPENLLESELFGYEEGAFTGAKKGGKAGLFELAHKGTIFLDEIAEITPKLQARLLRVLQEREIMRVGGEHVIPVDVRIIAATNKDLRNLVDEGVFRRDLYYRLNILFLPIPSLRVRRKDIPLLISYFLTTGDLQRNEIESINTLLIDELSDYPWLGNIRELENIVERILVIYRHTNNLHLIKDIIVELKDQNLYVEGSLGESNLDETIKKSELDYINQVLVEFGGNKNLAAKKLGISRTTLWRKLNQ